MKQLTLNDLINAFGDKAKAIGERLKVLGFEDSDIEGKFSRDLLGTSVYGSSFLKFFQDNIGVLSPKGSGLGFSGGFGEDQQAVTARLKELGIKEEDAKKVFGDDVLSLTLSGDEFQNLILANQDKVLQYIENEGQKAGANG